MKLLFIAHTLLIDCGKASKQTKGVVAGLFTEVGSPPANRYNTH
jgi:hypothetical protein